MKKHKFRDHEGQKYTCCICAGVEYADPRTLSRHLKKVHNGMNKRRLKTIEKEMKAQEKKQRLG